MNNERTLNFLMTTDIAVIACADEDLLCTFFKFMAPIYKRKYQTSSNEYEFKFITDYSDTDIVVVNDIHITSPCKEVSQQLVGLIENVRLIKSFVPLQCEKYSELRSIYFHLPEEVKPEVEIFVLRETEAGIKLECELGLLQGRYILYDYDKTTGIFRGKE